MKARIRELIDKAPNPKRTLTLSGLRKRRLRYLRRADPLRSWPVGSRVVMSSVDDTPGTVEAIICEWAVLVKWDDGLASNTFVNDLEVGI